MSFNHQGISVKALPCAPLKDVLVPATLQLTVLPQAKSGVYALVVTGMDMMPIQVPGAFTVLPSAPPPGADRGGCGEGGPRLAPGSLPQAGPTP